MSNSNQPKTKKVVKIVFNVVLWIFLVFAFLMMVLAFTSLSNNYGVPVVGKYVVLNVQSDSMSPTFKKGDMLVGTVLSDEEKANLQEGDIVTFFMDLNGDGKKELNTHRIVSRKDVGAFVTRGDNNPIDDTYTVYDNDIVSIWHENDVKIVGLGAVIGFLQSSVGFLVVIIIPLAAFFIYELVKFILLIIKIKGGDKKKLSPEEEAIRQRLYEEYLLKQQAENANDNVSENQENKE